MDLNSVALDLNLCFPLMRISFTTCSDVTRFVKVIYVDTHQGL